jgi:hypothetical protein
LSTSGALSKIEKPFLYAAIGGSCSSSIHGECGHDAVELSDRSEVPAAVAPYDSFLECEGHRGYFTESGDQLVRTQDRLLAAIDS